MKLLFTVILPCELKNITKVKISGRLGSMLNIGLIFVSTEILTCSLLYASTQNIAYFDWIKCKQLHLENGCNCYCCEPCSWSEQGMEQ